MVQVAEAGLARLVGLYASSPLWYELVAPLGLFISGSYVYEFPFCFVCSSFSFFSDYFDSVLISFFRLTFLLLRTPGLAPAHEPSSNVATLIRLVTPTGVSCIMHLAIKWRNQGYVIPYPATLVRACVLLARMRGCHGVTWSAMTSCATTYFGLNCELHSRIFIPSNCSFRCFLFCDQIGLI